MKLGGNQIYLNYKGILTFPLPLAKVNGSLNLLDKAILQKEVLKYIICSVSSVLIEKTLLLSLMDKL